jgi:serine/threonine-protein kinase
MFIDEARLAARIKHPNVVETLDILTMGQELLLVMEYIRGECFSKLLRAARRKNLEPSIGVVGRIASGMLHGLHAAHEATDDKGEPLHVVHRDISPQNVMIDVDGGVKVLDFGVAKASARIQITRDGQMKGKLSYMSPEQLQGQPVDRRADIFAAGVVLWEALTRRRLFVGEDSTEVLRKILRDEVPPPSQFVAGSSADVDRVVLRALCKDPEQRYQTARELALDVEQIIGLAPEVDVGEWIYSVAGEILTKRERLLQEIERLGPDAITFSGAEGGALVQGSFADSDTFQRIQSWAEREAARAADGASIAPEPEVDFEEGGAEGVPTVADINCVDRAVAREERDSSGIASAVDAVSSRAMSPIVMSPMAMSSVVESTIAEPAVALVEEPAPASVPLQPPAFALAASSTPAEDRQRRRRVFTAVAAAALFAGLVGIALVALKPAALVRTSGALRPETSASAASAPGRPSSAIEPPGAALASLKQANGSGNDVSAPIGGSVAPANQLSDAVGMEPRTAANSASAPTTHGVASTSSTSGRAAVAGVTSDSVSTRDAASRINQALSPAGKDRSGGKKALSARHTPGRKARATSNSSTAKVDCRQPYWIDDRGIRRIKLACL